MELKTLKRKEAAIDFFWYDSTVKRGCDRVLVIIWSVTFHVDGIQIRRTNTLSHATWISFGGDDDGEWCGSDDFPREMELVILQWNEMAMEVYDPYGKCTRSRGSGVRLSIFRACSHYIKMIPRGVDDPIKDITPCDQWNFARLPRKDKTGINQTIQI
jgi:hypothetical protein